MTSSTLISPRGQAARRRRSTTYSPATPGGTGRLAGKSAGRDPLTSDFSLSLSLSLSLSSLDPKKADGGVAGEVAAYLGGLRLEGAQKPLASAALLLAESLEAAPAYARARLARELHDLLTELEAQAARESDLAVRRNQRARERAWVADERSG